MRVIGKVNLFLLLTRILPKLIFLINLTIFSYSKLLYQIAYTKPFYRCDGKFRNSSVYLKKPDFGESPRSGFSFALLN